jgi:hypothetical protein
MNSGKYIGLDVHQATTVVAVTDSTGKLVMESILETEAATILQFFAGVRGTLSVTFEEGTWLTSCRLPWGLLFSSSHGRLHSFIYTLSLNLRGCPLGSCMSSGLKLSVQLVQNHTCIHQVL